MSSPLRSITLYNRKLILISAIIAHPTETIKCKLQLQLVQSDSAPKQFKGPVDVVRKTVAAQGIQGMWRGVGASFIYRSSFLAMFGGKSSCFIRKVGRLELMGRFRNIQQTLRELGWDELGDE